MNQTPVPDDLERRLAARLGSGPAPDLRGRVLTAVRSELARERSRRQPIGRWSFAAAAALVALCWANLSLCAANAIEPLPRSVNLDRDRGADLARLRALLPELSEREARRQALLSGICEALVPAPRLSRPISSLSPASEH